MAWLYGTGSAGVDCWATDTGWFDEDAFAAPIKSWFDEDLLASIPPALNGALSVTQDAQVSLAVGTTLPFYSETEMGLVTLLPWTPREAFDATGAGNVAAITQDAQTISAAGTAAVAGAAAVTQAGQTLSAGATVAVKGAAAITQAAETILATASDGDAGVLLVTQAPQTSAAAGAVAVAGASAITELPDTLTAQGGQPFVPPVQDNSGGGYFPQQTDRSRRKPQPPKPVEKPQPRVVQVTRVGRLDLRQEDGGMSAAGTVATGGDAVAKQAANGIESKAVVLISGFSWTDTPEHKSVARGAVEVKGGFRGHQYSEAKAAGVVDWRDVIAEEDQLLTPEMWKSYVVTRALKDFQ